MSAKITIGTMQNFEDVRRTNYDFNAVVDRLYDILGILPETPFDNVIYIVDWKLSDDDAKNALIKIKYRDKDAADDFTDNPEVFYSCWDVPARYLFMTEQEIVDDWNREQEEHARKEKAYQKALEAEQEQKQYKEYLRLKEVYEGTEAVNGLPEKSPNL